MTTDRDREVLRLLCKAVDEIDAGCYIPTDIANKLREFASAPPEDKPCVVENCVAVACSTPQHPLPDPKCTAASVWCPSCQKMVSQWADHDFMQKPGKAVTEEELRTEIDRALADALAPNAKGFMYYGDAARIAARVAMRVLGK